MRPILTLIALVAVLVAIGLPAYLNHKIAPISNAPLDMNSTLSLSSSAFDANASIPSKFTCDGSRVSPPLSISGAPENTESYVLIMDDPDIPQKFKDQLHIEGYVHWVLFNIPAVTTEIAAGTSAGTFGANTSGANEYAAPCPPPEYEPSEHRYIFSLYALNSTLSLKAGASKSDVETAMRGHIVAQTQLIGLYKRK